MARHVRPINPDQRYLSPRQCARTLGVSEYLIYRSVVAGEIPHRKIGQRILIPREWAESGEALEPQ